MEKEPNNKKKIKVEKSSPQIDPRLDRIEPLLKESLMFKNYFNDNAGFTSIPKGKLPLRFTMPCIKFNRIRNHHHHMRNLVSVMTLKGINNDIFHLIFP